MLQEKEAALKESMQEAEATLSTAKVRSSTTHPPTHPITHPLNNPPTQSPIYLFNQSPTYLPTHPLPIQSSTHPPTHPPTHLLQAAYEEKQKEIKTLTKNRTALGKPFPTHLSTTAPHSNRLVLL